MIGVDTNVLLRVIVRDDEAQYQVAHAFFSARSPDNPAYICLVVLIEFAWSLSRSYRYPPQDVIEAVRRLHAATDVVLEDQDIVDDALAMIGPGDDLPDLLIALGNVAAGCSRTVTFDRDAADSSPSMELLA